MLALSVLASALVVVFAWPRVQALLDRTSPPRIAARAIAKSLARHADTLGPIEVAGAELRLFEGRLRLSVSVPSETDGDSTMGHFHVLATPADAPTASLDACIIGVGDTPEKRLDSAVAALVGVALPPVLSQVKHEPLLGASPFWGDEPWSVPGMRGYVGGMLSRGSVDAGAFADAPLFSEIPDVPRDGGLHLVKAMLFPKDGFWLRTVEVDGHPTAVSERRLAPLDPQAKPGMIVRYAVIGGAATPAAADGRERAIERLGAREAWLLPGGDCPADLIPRALPEFSFSTAACRGPRLLDCLVECQRGAASFCYMAALEAQASDLDRDAVQALFLRSCRLGFASGCTNAAAGRLQRGAPMDRCSLQTFERICDRAGDPWACTMLGGALARAEPASRDQVRARAALVKACQPDPKDPACQTAKAILGTLEAPPTSVPPSTR